MSNKESTDLVKIQEEVVMQLENKEVMENLIRTTFKRLSPALVQQAIVEGMMRGYTFKDFLEQNVYAVPFGEGYTLVKSIGSFRKVAARSGLAGKDAPVFTYFDSGKVESCSITVYKLIEGQKMSFTATCYMDEYFNPKREIWVSKPRTMIAKVTEVHALRTAFPELDKDYIEEEMRDPKVLEKKPFDAEPYVKMLSAAKDMNELKLIWAKLPAEAKTNKEIEILKEDLKLKFNPDGK